MTRKKIKLRQMADGMPKRYLPAEIRRGTIVQIQEALGAMLGLTSSALGGNIQTLAVGIYEEIQE